MAMPKLHVDAKPMKNSATSFPRSPMAMHAFLRRPDEVFQISDASGREAKPPGLVAFHMDCSKFRPSVPERISK